MSSADSDPVSGIDADALHFGAIVTVKDAGEDAVNGVYTMTELCGGVGRYTKIGLVEDKQRVFWLYLLPMPSFSHGSEWRICSVPKGKQPGTGDCKRFYSVPLEEYSEVPPQHGWKLREHGIAPVPTLEVDKPKPIVDSYKEMLFTEKFSDVEFVCPDGEHIHAHKIILATSSPYFDKAFTEPWVESQCGQIKTTHESHIIKAMLTLIYTGDVDTKLIVAEPLEFLDIACEYQLPWLKTLAENACIGSRNTWNLKELWQAGRRYGSYAIKYACIEYAKEHSLEILAKSAMRSLEADDLSSWEEFSKAIYPSK